MYEINVIEIFNANFYLVSSSREVVLKIFPEILLMCCIMQSGIMLFEDSRTVPTFQFGRFYLSLILVIWTLLYKFLYCPINTTVLFGYSWIDSYYAVFSKIIVTSLSLAIILVAKQKFIYRNTITCKIDVFLIFGFALFFIFLLTSSYNFFAMFLAIEGLGLTLYTLAGLLHTSVVSIESALKYYALGALSTGIMLFGLSILFGIVGSLDFLQVKIFLELFSTTKNIEVKFSFLAIMFGFLFKIAAFPCHVWVADIYEGLWTPITAFFAVVVKVSFILFFLRVCFNIFLPVLYSFQNTLIVVSLGSMCIGTLGALKQVNVKRFIAYTSVNQVGFIFLGISCCNLAGLVSSLIYLILYATMSLSFFAILLNLKHGATNRGIIYLSDLSSVSTYHTEGSKHLVISLVSMAGLPPTGGFISKFIVYTAATEAGLSGVILFVILFSVITAYVYLSVVRQIWFEKSKAFKLYFFDSNIYLICLLRLISLYLCCFILFLPATLKLVLVLSISCMFPFLCTNSVTYNSIGGVYYVIA